MKKVVLASLLAVASALPLAQHGFAQAVTPAAGGQIQMSAEEFAAYNNAKTQTTPAAQAAAWEAYLKAYPQSAVKADALQQLVFADSQVDPAKTLDASDRLLQVDPNNFYALVFEATLRGQAASALTDVAARQSGLDAAADYARKGLAATKPKDTSDADFKALTDKGYPVFYSTVGTAALNRKDSTAAISAFKSELGSVPLALTTTPGLQLQDTYYLAQAYYGSTPPDYLNCTYYAARAMSYAPEPYKTTFKQLASYCYHKYHGPNDEGFDAMVAVAKDNLTPPAGFTVKAAPKPADIVANLIATTPNLAALALSDKEYVLQNGRPAAEAQPAADGKPAVEARPADADKVFDTIKGKSVEIPDALVIEATADQVKVAVSEDAVQSKTADFAFNMKEPLKTVPVVGAKVTLSGTYASYTQTPLLISMSDAAVIVKAKPPVKKAAPVHHTSARHK